jgi:hypothetical protein
MASERLGRTFGDFTGKVVVSNGVTYGGRIINIREADNEVKSDADTNNPGNCRNTQPH